MIEEDNDVPDAIKIIPILPEEFKEGVEEVRGGFIVRRIMTREQLNKLVTPPDS